MKTRYIKSGLLMTLAAMFFAACDSDRDSNPVLDTSSLPTTFVLNTPAYATQLTDLGTSSTINFTWNQPGYGFTAATTYAMQLSLDGNFTTDIATVEDGPIPAGSYYNLMGSFQGVKGGINAGDFNRGIVKLAGWEEEEDVPASLKAYVRCKATLADVNVPAIYSNTVEIMVVPSFNVAPSYAEYIYMMGNFNGWTDPVYMRSALDENGLPTGQYQCYNYLDGGFKFRPNVDNWDDDFGQKKESDKGLLVADDEEDCKSDPGFYQIDVDYPAMTYSTTLVESISIIGTVNGNWDNDTDMTYNQETGAWEVTTTLSDGQMKFRMNHDWAVSWGGANGDGNAFDNLTQYSGENLNVSAGTYKVELYIATEGNNKVVLTKK